MSCIVNKHLHGIYTSYVVLKAHTSTAFDIKTQIIARSACVVWFAKLHGIRIVKKICGDSILCKF